MSKSTLSCCLVVKNEQDNISKCLSCINLLADEIIIVDTGSTDGTRISVNRWIDKYKAHSGVKYIEVGNKFHDADGDFNFGAAKTFAFQNATKDYVMWLDATDRVTDQRKAKIQFLKETSKNKNVYFTMPTELTEDFAFIRSRIGPRDKSIMDGRIHEYMKFTSGEMTKIFIPVPIKNYKKERDLGRNIRQLLKEWDENPSARIAFYIGLTYRELNKLEESITWFRKRIYNFEFKDEFSEEYFKALESIAEMIIIAKNDSDSTMDLYDLANEMIQKEPNRYEGYYYMGKYLYRTQKYNEAIQQFRKYTKCKRPSSYKLWLNPKLYTGKAILNAIEECKTALKYSEVLQPDEILDYNQSRSTYKRGNTQY